MESYAARAEIHFSAIWQFCFPALTLPATTVNLGRDWIPEPETDPMQVDPCAWVDRFAG